MNKGMAILVAAALFASGLAVGGLGVHLFYAQKIAAVGGPPMPVGPMFEHWLLRRLELSEEQHREVRKILDDSRLRAESLRLEMGPRLRAMNRETVESIASVLTPGQRETFAAQMERWERRQRDFPPREGPPRGRGRGPRRH